MVNDKPRPVRDLYGVAGADYLVALGLHKTDASNTLDVVAQYATRLPSMDYCP